MQFFFPPLDLSSGSPRSRQVVTHRGTPRRGILSAKKYNPSLRATLLISFVRRQLLLTWAIEKLCIIFTRRRRSSKKLALLPK